MSIGARTIKTGVAVAISMLICKLWRIEPAVFAAITAVVNMQPSVGQALRNAWQQIAVRVKRRQDPDSPLPTDGMSPEFRAILDLLMVGEEKLAVQPSCCFPELVLN